MGEIFIDHDLAERRYVFTDRTHAGLVVARMLTEWRGRSDEAAVLAIPVGGVPVGLAIARALGLPFDMLFIRKLHFPDNPESGFGAVSEHGEVLLNERLARLLDRKTIERQYQSHAWRTPHEVYFGAREASDAPESAATPKAASTLLTPAETKEGGADIPVCRQAPSQTRMSAPPFHWQCWSQ